MTSAYAANADSAISTDVLVFATDPWSTFGDENSVTREASRVRIGAHVIDSVRLSSPALSRDAARLVVRAMAAASAMALSGGALAVPGAAVFSAAMYPVAGFFASLVARSNSVSSVSPLTIEKELRARVQEIASLEPGWLDGEGEKPSPVVLRFIREAADYLVTIGPPRARLYPTPEGGVQIEWSSQATNYSLEISPDMAAFLVYSFDDESRSSETRDYDAIDLADLLKLLDSGASA